MNTRKNFSWFRPTLSLGIVFASLALAYFPGGSKTRLVVVSGTELQEPLTELRDRYQQQHPDVAIDLRFQGSQDIVNNLVDRKNDFEPTLVIPASGELVQSLEDRLQAQGETQPFAENPQPIAKTLLVAIAWPERANTLFPSGTFRWSDLEKALQAKNWGTLGGQVQWGSFDFLITDPTRSNSGQLTLALWSQAKTQTSNVEAALQQTEQVDSLLGLVKKSVYQPPRSTDILLQEFISRGPNDADMATVYESIALHRWQDSKIAKGQPYQIFYPETTVETVATGAILSRNTSQSAQEKGRAFLKFMGQSPQQEVFIRYGFRPIPTDLDVASITNSPWNQSIQGSQLKPKSLIVPAPDERLTAELVKAWQRAN